jgi:Tfp pilus assembly protein PilF
MAEQKGDMMRASAAYEELLQKNPQKAEVHHRLGILCQKSGRAEEAVQHLSQAHQLAPMDIEVLCDLGYIHYLQNRPKEAISTLQKAQQINPGHERTQANLAVALIAMDQVPSAVALLRQNMGEAPAATMVGFALAQRGELDQARKYFTQALDADATNQPAAEALVQIEEMLKAQQNSDAPAAQLAQDTGVVASGQMAALPFEVISEGVVTRPTPATASGNSPIAAVRDSGTVLPATAAGGVAAGRVERAAASTATATGQSGNSDLPSIRMSDPRSSAASQSTTEILPGRAAARPAAEKKIEPRTVTVRDPSAADSDGFRNASASGSTLPPVESVSSWRPSRQKSSSEHPEATEGLHFAGRPGAVDRRNAGLWRSAAAKISKVGFSEPADIADEPVEFTEAVELPPVDAIPLFTGSHKGAVASAGLEKPQRRQSMTIDRRSTGFVAPQAQTPPVASGSSAGHTAASPVANVAPSAPAPAPVAATAVMNPPTPVVHVSAPSPAPAPAAVAAPAVASPRAATGTVGGLPLAFLRAMYVQMNEEQKVTFWKDLRKLPGEVSDAELSAYRELARSTDGLPRVEAAMTLLAVFHEDKLATELLSNLDKSQDPVVRQAASTAESMLQIQLSGKNAK